MQIIKNVAHHYPAVILSMMLCFCFSCMPYRDGRPDTETGNIRPIAVMPFLKGEKPENVETFMTCQVGRLCTAGEAIAPDAEKVMTDIMNREMAERYPDRMISAERSLEVFNRIAAVDTRATPLDLALRLGGELNAGYVLIGNIRRFSRRSGNALGSNLPSSVAFNVHLIDVDRGARLWKGSFDKTQQPVTDNLLKVDDLFKEGRKWLTAEELARTGVEEVLKNFPLLPAN